MTVPDTDFKGVAVGSANPITSNALSVSAGDFLTVAIVHADNDQATAWTLSNTGTAITWTKRAETNTLSNCKVVMWSGTAGATPPTTVSVNVDAGTTGNGSRALFVAVHNGQHAANPLPSGNIFSGTGGTDVTQAITPTTSGSALWMVAGDWSQTNSFAGSTDCSLVAAAYNEAGQQTAAAIQPTIQPRPNATTFTIGETDTSGKIAWVAWEVQSAGNPMTFAQNRRIRPAAFRPGLGR